MPAPLKISFQFLKTIFKDFLNNTILEGHLVYSSKEHHTCTIGVYALWVGFTTFVARICPAQLWYRVAMRCWYVFLIFISDSMSHLVNKWKQSLHILSNPVFVTHDLRSIVTCKLSKNLCFCQKIHINIVWTFHIQWIIYQIGAWHRFNTSNKVISRHWNLGKYEKVE